MRFLRLLQLLILLLSLLETNVSWAMTDEIDSKQVVKKRRAEENRAPAEKRSNKTPVKLDLKSITSGQRRTLFDQFKEIVEKEPNPLAVIRGITAQDEDREGSRKWVKSFTGPQGDTIHEWHQRMKGTIEALRKENSRGKYFPLETNFAVVRLTYVLEKKDTDIKEIPFFFLSGWPANAKIEPAGKLAKSLSEKNAGSALKEYSHYGIRFITMSFSGNESQELFSRTYPFGKTLNEIFQKELVHPMPILGVDRLRTHSRLVSEPEGGILSKLYFHSEQAIWTTVKDEIKNYRDNKRNGHVLRQDGIQCVIIDICSYYDMCWCCGDSLASCCHINQLEFPVYVRATGCTAYYDSPFDMNPKYSLRDHRTEFVGYAEGKAYEMQESGQYKPYIAHAVASDFHDQK